MTKEQQAAFDKFWNEHWPKCRRKDKKKALEQWTRIPAELYPVIFAAVDRQKKQPSWNKDDCAYIPYAFRWLRDHRWEDEVVLPEDRDAETLIAALTEYATMPAELPQKIANRFRRMCMRLKTNWPELHIYAVRMEDEAYKYIRKEFLTTDWHG